MFKHYVNHICEYPSNSASCLYAIGSMTLFVFLTIKNTDCCARKKYQCKAGASFVIGSCFYNYISFFSFTLWQGDIASADSNKKTWMCSYDYKERARYLYETAYGSPVIFNDACHTVALPINEITTIIRSTVLTGKLSKSFPDISIPHTPPSDAAIDTADCPFAEFP